MKKYWKRLEEWVTGLKNDPFQQARLKLTIIYSCIITLAILFYLVLLYREFGREIYDFTKANIPSNRQQIFVNRSTIIARTTLFTIQIEDVGMFFVTIIISYLLAGIALKPIKKTLQSQKQFIAIASHELRTPLSIIRVEMETFLRDKNNNSHKNLMRNKQSIVSNLEEIDRMQQIIDNLLFVSRIDSSIDQFHFIKIDLAALLKQIQERLQKIAKRKGINLSLQVKDSLTLLAEPFRLEQAILNIVTNAIKYTKKGGSITIEAINKPKGIVLRVSDTGVGISKRDMPYIFNRFYRSDNKSTKKIEGVGLGLYIAQTIIHAHKGDIHVTSIVGKGTTVEIFLPQKVFFIESS